MTTLTLWLSSALVRDLGWALIHFLWQGLVLAGLMYLLPPRCRSAASRHDRGLGILVLMAAAPVLTILILRSQAHTGAALLAAPGLLLQGAMAGGKAGAGAVQPGLLVWLVPLWLAGVVVLSLRAMGGWLLAESWRHLDTTPLPSDLQRRCRELQQRLAPARPVRFLQSRRTSSPVVIGWLKPVVLLPVAALAGLPVQQLEALVLHELAHIARRDAFANALQVAVETVLFYHPAVWWVSRQVRTEREHCCDDVAVSACGDVTTYVEALISLESKRRAPNLALAAGGAGMKDRIRRLLGTPSASRRSPSAALVGLALLGLLFVSVATAQTAAPQGHQTLAIRVVDDSTDGNAVPPGDDRVVLAHPAPGEPPYLFLKREDQIRGDVVAEAHVAITRGGRPTVMLTLTPEAGANFQDMTRRNVGHRLAVVVNNRVVTAPTVMEPILGSALQIDARFADEAAARALIAEMLGTGR